MLFKNDKYVYILSNIYEYVLGLTKKKRYQLLLLIAWQ